MLLRTERKHKTFVSGLSARLRTTAAWSMSLPSWTWRRWSCRASRWGRATFPLHLLTLSLWNSYGFQSPSGEFLLSIYPVSGGPESKSCWGQDAFSYQVRNYRIENLKIFHWTFDLLEQTGTRSSVRTRRWTRWRPARGRTPSSWRTCPASGEQIFALYGKLVSMNSLDIINIDTTFCDTQHCL